MRMNATDGQDVAQGVLIGRPLQPDRLRVLGDVLAYHLVRPLSTCHARTPAISSLLAK